MRFSKVIGLWIITLFMFSSVGACEVNASRNTDFRRVHNDNIINTISNTNVLDNHNSLISTNDVDTDTLTYDEMLDYLLRHDEDQHPDYFVMVGAGNNPKEYKYKLSVNKPDGYHDVNENYHDLALNNPGLKGTLLYVNLDNYNLKTQFLINNKVSFNMTNWVIFQKDLRDSQYWRVQPVVVNLPKFPYTNDEIKDICESQDIIRITELILGVSSWAHYMLMVSSKELNAYTQAAAEVSVQNTKVAQARGDKSGKYWSPDINGGYFEDVDDDGLELINMYDQSVKSVLDKVRFALQTVMLTLDTDAQLLTDAADALPSEFGIDKGLKFAANVLKHLKLVIAWIDNELIDDPYHTLDQETMLISAEKSYRKLIQDGVLQPRNPTPNEIAAENYRIDQHIKNLKDHRQAQYDRIHDPDYLANIKKDYETELDRLYNKIGFLKDHRGDSKLIDLYQREYNELYSYYMDTTNLSRFQEKELSVWDDYSSRIDVQIDTLNGMRWEK